MTMAAFIKKGAFIKHKICYLLHVINQITVDLCSLGIVCTIPAIGKPACSAIVKLHNFGSFTMQYCELTYFGMLKPYSTLPR
jgi:hypothetical protein